MSYDLPVARSTDPDTSHAAAASVTDIRQSQEYVYSIIKQYGPLTDQQIESIHSIDIKDAESKIKRQSPSGLRTRRSELVRMGLVYDTGHRVRIPSGRMAVKWAVRD